jgi:DNA-binding NarL/FixJ family response regulator
MSQAEIILTQTKEEPTEKDRLIAALLSRGKTMRQIGDEFGDRQQSVWHRVKWMQAKRWMTWDMRILDRHQRRRLIQREKEFIEVEGV